MTYHSSMSGDLTPGTFPSSQDQTASRVVAPMFIAPSANLMAVAPGAPARPSGNLAPAPTLPAIPACLDATWQAARSYCETYPAANGPDATANMLCRVGRSQPAWYSQVQSTPACGGGAGPGPVYVPPVDTPPVKQTEPQPEPEPKDASEPNYMLWGGLALLVVAAGGGLYYYSRKKAA